MLRISEFIERIVKKSGIYGERERKGDCSKRFFFVKEIKTPGNFKRVFP
jgi:hypothetical protein